MAHAVSAWVTVKDAAGQVGVTENRLRVAYRRGDLDVIDDLVAGRTRKLVNIDEVRHWAGIQNNSEPPAEQPGAAIEGQLEEIAAGVRQALDRASRAEQQVAYLQNELAQLRAAHGRVQEIVDERSFGAFQAVATAVAASVLDRPRRRRFPRIGW